MTLTRKIRTFFAAIAATALCFAASTAFATIIATNDFETAYNGFSASTGQITDAAALATYGTYPSESANFPFSGSGVSGFGNQYLDIDTDDAMVWRSFDSRSANTYIDVFTQFTPLTDDIGEYPEGAKILVYLDAATSNLCVISGTAANDQTPVTNRLTTAIVEPNIWGRLTVNATASDGVFAFQVKLNGTLLATAGSVSTFYSMAAGTTVSKLGFHGAGAIDNLVVRSTDPFGTAVATINGEGYATLEAALAEADADTVVTLAADHAGKVYLADAATYKIAPGAYSFGGVVGANGYKVTASEPVAGVTTYTATDAFASQPSPVVVWDGASENYDFNTLTRTVGANTYTLNLNEQNSVGGSGAYVQIGPNNAQAGVTMTVQNSNPAVTNGFGTAGTVTVIMKCRNMPVTASSYRAIITLMDGKKYKYGGTAQTDNGAVLGMYINAGTSGWVWKGSTAGMAGLTGDFVNTVSGAFSDGEQTVALTYSNTGGTAYYVNGEQVQANSGLKASAELAAPYGVSLGGVDVATGSQFYALTGMQIEAVAVFTSTLTAEQIAAFTFPSSRIAEDIAVSEINAIFGSAGEIWLDVADGVTITGDTTFNASTVHFASAGEVVLYPPAGNAATLDFSGVAKPVVAYNGVLPTQSGSTFTATTVPTWVTDAAQWTGTVWVKNNDGITADNFNPNNLGNVSSTLRLTMIRGYLKAMQSTSVLTTTFNPAIELDDDGNGYSLCIHDAYSYGGSYNEYTVFRELKGDGTFVGRKKDDGNGGPYALFQIQNWDHFTGTISLTNQIISFGATIPAANEFSNENYGRNGGLIFVMPDATVTIPSGKTWYAANTNYTGYANGSIIVKGELRVTGVNQIDAASIVTTTDTGTFTLTSTGNGQETETDTSYARITGTGTLKYEGTGWRALSANNFPTNMTLVNEQAGDILLSRALTYTVGSFAGSKNLQGNYGNGKRKLRILQAKDTEWSGINNPDVYSRLDELIVAPGASTSGTLTLSGEQTQSTKLTIESGAKVNLTGTWKGAVTVAGTIGGTGAISGSLTLSNGATLKVSDTANPLYVSGTISATGTVDIKLPAETVITNETTIMSGNFSGVSGTFNVFIGETAAKLRVKRTSAGLKVAPRGPTILFY